MCGLLSGLRVEGGQMINGSEGVPWVDGDTLKPDSGGISLGSQSTAAGAKGTDFHCARQMSSHLQSSKQRPDQGLSVF